MFHLNHFIINYWQLHVEKLEHLGCEVVTTLTRNETVTKVTKSGPVNSVTSDYGHLLQVSKIQKAQ